MLAGREGIHLSRSTVRRVLLAGGVRSPRRRRARRRYLRRARYPQEGMLLQIDGSRHDWLEGRGPRLTLIGAVDDATGMVPFALFREQEDAQGYMLMLKEVIERCGVPLALYSDRHSIFQRSPLETESRDEQLRGRREPTQFARALAELGIELILAHTPQAKGRVERAWDTFQDRLVSEMRLAGTATIAGGQPDAVGLPAALRSAVRRGACPAGLGLSPTAAGRLAGGGLVLQVLAHVGPRVRHYEFCNGAALPTTTPSASRRSATTAPRWPQGQLRPGPRGSPGTAGRQHRGRPPGQNRGHEAAPAEPVVLRARSGRRPNGQPPVDSHPLLDDIGHGAQTAAPRPPAKTQARIPTKPALTHPWRRALLT